MSIYRRKYWVLTAKGVREKRTQRHYTIEVRHPVTLKIVRKRGSVDRKVAKVMEAELIRNFERGMVHMEDVYREHRATPIRKVIGEYVENLKTEGNDDKYVETCEDRLFRLAIECNWQTIYDATQTGFEKWRTATKKKGYLGKPTKPKTLNQFLATASSFFKWCRRHKKIDRNPLEDVEKVKEIHNDRFRRAATPEELGKFLAKLPSDGLRRFYIFLAYTALRRASLEALRWEDFELTADQPTVTVRGESNKIRRSQTFPLRRDLAKLLIPYEGTPREKAFAVPTIDEHKEYLKVAGIPFDDGAGQDRLDIHAFRKTLQSWLEDAGVDVREASKALGHLHLSTTLKSYRPKKAGNADAGVEKLPKLIRKGKRVD
jgi:integrase